VSGPAAGRVASAILTRREPLVPRVATLTRVRAVGRPTTAIDTVIATLFPAPHSFTGDDTVEVSAHGSPVVLQQLLEAARAAGARLARAGEFTLRAFLNGRLDLVQAEAVGDLVDAITPVQAQAAFDQLQGTLTTAIAEIDGVLFHLVARLEASLDFPEEGYHFIGAAEARDDLDRVGSMIGELLGEARRGRLLRDGALVVIAGRPNVGKSSLFNALCGTARAIVAPGPGTTRDLVTERIDLAGMPVTIVDTAGLRTALDEVEQEGVDRASQASRQADLLLVVLDLSQDAVDEDRDLLVRSAGRRHVIVGNKADVASGAASTPMVRVSAVTGEGLDELRIRMRDALTGGEALQEGVRVTNARHAALLEVASASVRRAAVAAGEGHPEEFVLAELQAARDALAEVTGGKTPEDVLRHIFERFCIGK
jgi:tRNA modification GTPase